MLPQQQLSVASALVALVAASPIEIPNTKAAFSVHQTVAKPFIRSGPAAVVAIYRKFSKQVPADVKVAATNNDGTVSAAPELFDSEYLCPVNIGGQILNMNLDTGSSDLYVLLCSICYIKMSHSAHSAGSSPRN